MYVRKNVKEKQASNKHYDFEPGLTNACRSVRAKYRHSKIYFLEKYQKFRQQIKRL